MQTHDNLSHAQQVAFMERLKERAAKMAAIGQCTITAGEQGEQPLAVWKAWGVQVTHMPDDEQGVLRISAGGGPTTPVPLNYCTIRGNVGQCIDLLEKVIKALKKAP